MHRLVTEVREWLALALSAVAVYLGWRPRSRRDGGAAHLLGFHDTVGVRDAVEPALLNLSSVQGTSSAHLELSVPPAIIDDMAYTDPDFPQF